MDLKKRVKYFITKINANGGWCDEVDIYRLTSLYVEMFGIEYYDNLSIEDESILMWEKIQNFEFKEKRKLKDLGI